MIKNFLKIRTAFVKSKLSIANCRLLIIQAALLLCIITNSFAQTGISLQSAIDSALKNNLTISNEKLKTEQARALIQSATTIPATNINSELGQVSSSYFDTKIGVTQTFSFPAVYAKQKNLFTEEWKATLLNVSLKEAEIKKAVTGTFYMYRYWKEKEKLLTSIDSIYNNLLQKAVLRLQKGESNILEKTTFETQRSAIAIQLLQIQQEAKIAAQIFQLLLNTTHYYQPEIGTLKIQEPVFAAINEIENHPSLKIIGQQQEIAKATTQVEKSKLLPDILLGYSNASMQGMGADEKMYNAGHRFHTAHVGIGIPIFTSAQKARIKASRINEQVFENNYNIEKQLLKNKLAAAITRYQQNKQTIELYETAYLKNIHTIKETAYKQFINGEINYLDFVMLLNQAITIQNNFVDALHNLNQSAIELNFLNSKN